MEAQALLGFKETLTAELVVNDKSSCYKLVPWISWDDWTFVRNSLFSSSPNSIAIALRRISTWRSRGSVPISIDVTASIIEIQQKDPFFRNDLSEESSPSEEILAMLYCMAIMRLVNGVVEKTRKKNEVSIGEAADAIGLPRMLIDIRHEGSHRDLPSLRLVRLASIKALEWLKIYYWEPQKTAIPSDRTQNIRKEIKSTLRELAFSLKLRQSTQSNSPIVKTKRSKKQINKILKNILRLYYSFSSEVISVLLEFLLKAFNSVDLTQNSEVNDEWKSFIIKLSNKEPQLLFTLINAVLEMIESQETAKYISSRFLSGAEQKTNGLSNLLEWLISNITKLKEGLIISETQESSTNLTKLIHKCLLLSSPSNNLTSTAVVLARITKNTPLIEKLNKLATLHSSNIDINIDTNEEDSIRRAAEKLKILKKNKNNVNAIQCRWSVVRRWNACPIGMLPRDVGSSGWLPVLERKNEGDIEKGKMVILSKREAEVCVEDLDDSVSFKKMKESEMNDEVAESGGGVEGKLMIGGILREVSEDEVLAIASDIRVLI